MCQLRAITEPIVVSYSLKHKRAILAHPSHNKKHLAYLVFAPMRRTNMVVLLAITQLG